MVDGTLGNPTTELLAAPKSVVVSNPVVETAVIAPDEAPAPSITDVPYPTVPSLSPPSTPNPASVVVAVAPSITDVPYPTVPSLSPPSTPNPASVVVVVVSAPKAAPVEKAAPAPAPSITEVPYPTVLLKYHIQQFLHFHLLRLRIHLRRHL